MSTFSKVFTVSSLLFALTKATSELTNVGFVENQNDVNDTQGRRLLGDEAICGDPWLCGQSIKQCGTGGPLGQCFCSTTTEGEPSCWENNFCSSEQSCSSTSQCGAGYECVPNTCCGSSKCLKKCSNPYENALPSDPCEGKACCYHEDGLVKGHNFNVDGIKATFNEILDAATNAHMQQEMGTTFGDALCGYYPPSLGWSGGFGITDGKFEFEVETFTAGKGEYYYLPIIGDWCMSDGPPHHGFIPASGEIQCCEKEDLVNGVCQIPV